MSRLSLAALVSSLALCTSCKTATTESSPNPSQSAAATSAKSPASIDPSTPPFPRLRVGTVEVLLHQVSLEGTTPELDASIRELADHIAG